MKVMIAESNDAYRIMLEQVVKGEDHKVMSFNNGTEALKAYEQSKDIDVVFSDRELPGLDGLELSKRIRQVDKVRGKDSYIILTADRGGKWDIMQAMEMGVNDLITKPYAHDLVTDRLRSSMIHFILPHGEERPLESDPIAHLLMEHKILRFQGKKLEELIEKIDEESSQKLEKWLGGRMFVLETDVHQDKESSLSITFLERLVKAQGEEIRGISESSAEWVEKEHQELENVVKNVKDNFHEYMEALAKPKEDIKDFNIMEHIKDYPAFCLKCDKKVGISKASLFQMENGSYAFKGECDQCGSGVTTIIGRTIDASQKNIKLKRSLNKYLSILNEHLGREEKLYFPLIKKYFTQADNERLMLDFERIEKEYGIDRIGKDFKLLE